MGGKTLFRILVIDDFEAARQFICWKLQERAEFRVIGEASDGLEAVQKAKELQPDLILLDIALPGLSGIEAAERISVVAPRSRILYVSQNRDPDVVNTALSDRGQGYVLKSEANSELLPAVDAVLRGEKFVSRGLVSLKG